MICRNECIARADRLKHLEQRIMFARKELDGSSEAERRALPTEIMDGGNTNGKGAAVGIFHVIGLPFPSPGPLLKLAQWVGTEVANLGASSYSTENVPAWWTSQERASEGYL